MAAPLYVAEVAMASRRGPLGTAFQLLVTVGVFLCYAIGSAVSWSWLAVTGAALCFLHAVLLLYAPETPRWLLGKNDSQVRASSGTSIIGYEHHRVRASSGTSIIGYEHHRVLANMTEM